MLKITFAVFLLLLTGYDSTALAADGCQLAKVTSLEMSTDRSGRVFVPATIAGHTVNLLVDTGGIYSMLTEHTVKSLGLVQEPISRLKLEIYGGFTIDRYVRADNVALGQLTTPSWKFVVMPDALQAEIGGTLAPDIMRNYDMDFDFAASKLNLFSQDHCPGKVVYWTHTKVAQIPVELDRWGHLKLSVQVDGKKIPAGIDTGSWRSVMSLETAENEFGFDEKDSRLKPAVPDPDAKAHVFTFPFKRLALEGVTVSNPDIVLVPNRESRIRSSDPRLILGMGVLRQLHLYIAYDEEKLYATAASASFAPGDDPEVAEEGPPPSPVLLHCTNPAVEAQFTPEGPPGFVTARVTFAVNFDAPSGAVHVTPGNDGVCTVTASEGTVIAGSSFQIEPDGSDGKLTRELLKHVEIGEQIKAADAHADSKIFVFTVRAKDRAPGTLVLDFPVRYR